MPPQPAALPLEVDCATVKAKLDSHENFLLLDCRERDEHQFVHIPEAVLLPMSELSQRAVELNAHQQRLIIVHCHHGGRSLRVANWLRNNGFLQAQSMAGGIDEWATQIDPRLPRY